MFRSVRENKGLVLLILILFGLLVLMSAQVTAGESSVLEKALFRLTSPIVRLFAGSSSAVRKLWSNHVGLRGVRGENRDLVQRIQALELERAGFEEVLRENDRLRDLLRLRARLRHASIVAKIVSNESLGPQRALVLDRGERDGVSLDMPVFAPNGVVGRVIAVASRACKVQLVTDAGSGTAVTVARSRLQGMVFGRGGDTLRLRYIPKLEDVRPGDRLVTSGLDRIYPPGYPVGTVLRASSGSGPMKVIEVSPAADPSRMEEVLLLVVDNGEDLDLPEDLGTGPAPEKPAPQPAAGP